MHLQFDWNEAAKTKHKKEITLKMGNEQDVFRVSFNFIQNIVSSIVTNINYIASIFYNEKFESLMCSLGELNKLC